MFRHARSGGYLLVAMTILLLASAGAAGAVPVPVKAGIAKPSDFAPPTSCGCHASRLDEWDQSMHSKALLDPIYLAKLAEANKATNGALDPFCRECHGPAAVMTGEVSAKKQSAGVAGGIQCSWCHQVVGNSGAPGNVSQLLTLDGVYRAQLQGPDAPHKAAYSAFHDSATVCGGCHNVNHPLNGLHLESTFAEWQKSPQAARGISCQDCHMSRGAGVTGPFQGVAAPGAAPRKNLYAMTFAGGQVELGNASAAKSMLESAAKIEIEAPAVLAGGSKAKVTITNSGAGHYLPTGLTEVREMWLEVYTQDAEGNKTALGEHRFGTILEDAKGKAPVELWEAVKIKSDDRIAPGATFTDEFTIKMPEGAEAATLVAVLNYRSTGDDLAAKAGTKNPVTKMAVAEQAIFTSDEAQAEVAREDANQGAVHDTFNLVVIVLGMLLIVGLVAWGIVLQRRS